jgi:hypothetical protein
MEFAQGGRNAVGMDTERFEVGVGDRQNAIVPAFVGIKLDLVPSPID